MVKLITLLNVLVFACWIFLDPKFMTSHFLVSFASVLEGRPWTLLTSVFSHNMLFHLLINMFVLRGFDSAMEAILGSSRFITFYLWAGMLGSLGHCVASYYLMHNPYLPALGASGAVAGVLVLYSFTFPKSKVLLLGIIPMPAVVGALVFVGLDVWGLMAQTQGGGLPIGHGAHLGGAMTGIVYYLFLRRKIANQL